MDDDQAERLERAKAGDGRASGNLLARSIRRSNHVVLAVALAVIVLSVASIGVLLMARGTGRTSYGGPEAGTRYTVTTSLMAAKGGPLNACFATPLPYPPIGCGGVEVTNVDVTRILGTTTYPNGTVATPTVKLVGTWDGRVLRLTEQPQPTKVSGTEAQPVAQTPPASSAKSTQEVLQELRSDNSKLRQRGIVLLEWGEGAGGVEVTLVVADPDSVQYLYDTYGRMRISGWLQPVNPVSPTSLTSPTPSSNGGPVIYLPTDAQLSAPSGNVVWAFVAGGLLFRSSDGGNNWEQRPLPPYHGGGSPEISFADAQHGWYSTGGVPETQCNGAGEQIWQTVDRGTTWNVIASVVAPQGGPSGIGYAQCKEGISFIDPTHGFLDAWDDNHPPTIYRTSDGGRSWKGSTLPDPPGFKGQNGGFELRAGLVKGFGGMLLVLATSGQGDGYVFRSTDGGASWAFLAKAGGANYLTFVTATRWLTIGNDSTAAETTDAGKTWHPFATDYSNAAGVGTTFVFGDAQVGYGTVRGGIQKTVDGGAHWSIIATPGVVWPG
ncbi:MAG: WD40/YVTN/BNR-like repeat-containing protein [Candidatus Dormibacteraceae bacterium]